MAELTTATEASSCCSPAAQESCCEPSEKSACCGTSAAGGSCGCAAGTSAEPVQDIREKYGAATRQAAQGEGVSAIVQARKPA